MNTLTPSTLYILLQSRSSPSTFHWSLYLTNTHPPFTTGTKHDLTHPPSPSPDLDPRTWTYSSFPIDLLSPNAASPAIAAVKVDVMDDAEMLREAMEECLGNVPRGSYSSRFREEMSCRVWVMEALWELDQGGFIDLGGRVNVLGIQGLEREVVRAGLVAMWRGDFGVYELGEEGVGLREVG
ncbi:hypothetical protein BDV23DRAFT_183425 [Aspergillus alliaceus]|uniref:Uncharacterized protein n=1 Tax=Petromyces alliaceus TaxID=209559 RepID=A0A5N6FHF7_PETAA|nr:uncharacterized protein BDW43DRAFT_315785 [Aspergillus alliaceus]KAB8228565.1 hypothetical protein BDW43DRAFT_315785 [Aspergillus alliaceus]KAE8390516.1 hypothetical protein BDV23DRAFT_183425 [Aspergillus alliaceus]